MVTREGSSCNRQQGHSADLVVIMDLPLAPSLEEEMGWQATLTDTEEIELRRAAS